MSLSAKVSAIYVQAKADLRDAIGNLPKSIQMIIEQWRIILSAAIFLLLAGIFLAPKATEYAIEIGWRELKGKFPILAIFESKKSQASDAIVDPSVPTPPRVKIVGEVINLDKADTRVFGTELIIEFETMNLVGEYSRIIRLPTYGPSFEQLFEFQPPSHGAHILVRVRSRHNEITSVGRYGTYLTGIERELPIKILLTSGRFLPASLLSRSNELLADLRNAFECIDKAFPNPNEDMGPQKVLDCWRERNIAPEHDRRLQIEGRIALEVIDDLIQLERNDSREIELKVTATRLLLGLGRFCEAADRRENIAKPEFGIRGEIRENVLASAQFRRTCNTSLEKGETRIRQCRAEASHLKHIAQMSSSTGVISQRGRYAQVLQMWRDSIACIAQTNDTTLIAQHFTQASEQNALADLLTFSRRIYSRIPHHDGRVESQQKALQCLNQQLRGQLKGKPCN